MRRLYGALPYTHIYIYIPKKNKIKYIKNIYGDAKPIIISRFDRRIDLSFGCDNLPADVAEIGYFAKRISGGRVQ